MHRSARVALALCSPLLVLACNGGTANHGTGGGGSGPSGPSGLPCDVEAVLVKNCQACHASSPRFGAPMPLVTHANLTAPAVSDGSRRVYELVGERIHDDANPMPQPPNPRLDDADMATLDAWIAKGAPSSTEDCHAGTGGSGGAGGGPPVVSCTPDLHLEPPTAYAMPQDVNDIYVCYGFDVTPAEKRHITAFAPRIDNAKIVHHLVLFESTTSEPTEPSPCSLGGAGNWRMVSVWAPGGKGFELPQEAGIPLEGTTHYVVQVHYNNLQHLAGEVDRSGFDLCSTADLRPNDADILAFGSFQFTIPAHGKLDITCDLDVPAFTPALHLVGSMPHMHQLGTLISTVNHPGGTGAPVDLGTRDPWDFGTQYWTTFDQVVKAGDRVSTRCAWDNPGDAPVSFGEGTADEMCFSFTMYYPKITLQQWSWGAPAYASKCAPTP